MLGQCRTIRSKIAVGETRHRAGRAGLALALGLAALIALWEMTAMAVALSASLGAVACLVLMRLPAGASIACGGDDIDVVTAFENPAQHAAEHAGCTQN